MGSGTTGTTGEESRWREERRPSIATAVLHDELLMCAEDEAPRWEITMDGLGCADICSRDGSNAPAEGQTRGEDVDRTWDGPKSR